MPVSQGSSPLPSRRKHTLRKLALSLAVTVLALVLVELGMRAWLSVRGHPYDADQVEQRIQSMLSPIRSFVPAGVERTNTMPDGTLLPILHPYSGAELYHDTGGVLEYFRTHPDSPDYEIVVLGGSVAAGLISSEGERMAQQIGADPRLAGRHVQILNYAHASYKEPQQLNRLTYLLSLGAKPEAVIELDGFNEVGLAIENAHSGTNPLYPSAPTWAASAGGFGVGAGVRMDVVAEMYTVREQARSLVERTLHWRLARSCALGTWVVRRLNDLNVRRLQLQKNMRSMEDLPRVNLRLVRQVQGPEYSEDEKARMDMCVNAWFEGSLSLDAVCRVHGIQYLHVLQPALGDEGAKPKSAEEMAITPPSIDWIEGPHVGYPLMRARARELVARGVAFLDASHAFERVTTQLYVDPCHFNRQGNQILAEMMVPEVCKGLVVK